MLLSTVMREESLSMLRNSKYQFGSIQFTKFSRLKHT